MNRPYGREAGTLVGASAGLGVPSLSPLPQGEGGLRGEGGVGGFFDGGAVEEGGVEVGEEAEGGWRR